MTFIPELWGVLVHSHTFYHIEKSYFAGLITATWRGVKKAVFACESEGNILAKYSQQVFPLCRRPQTSDLLSINPNSPRIPTQFLWVFLFCLQSIGFYII